VNTTKNTAAAREAYPSYIRHIQGGPKNGYPVLFLG